MHLQLREAPFAHRFAIFLAEHRQEVLRAHLDLLRGVGIWDLELGEGIPQPRSAN